MRQQSRRVSRDQYDAVLFDLEVFRPQAGEEMPAFVEDAGVYLDDLCA